MEMDDLDSNSMLYSLVCQCDTDASEFESYLKMLPNVDETLLFLHERENQTVNLLMLAALHGKDELVRIILSLSTCL